MSLKSNKRGIAILELFKLGPNALIIAIFIGVMVLIFSLITTNLGKDIKVGQVNLGTATNQTLGQLNTGLQSSADTIGIIVLFGMTFFMIINAYTIGSQNIKLFWIVDAFLLIFAFIISVYVSRTYEILIHSTEQLSVYTTVIPNTSKFVLNLPLITSISGFVIMILSYSGIKKRTEENTNVLGY